MKKLAIVTSYFRGDAYGVMGPQTAAAIMAEYAPCECIVVGVSREDDKDWVKKGLADFFGGRRPVVAFSTLSGREDLFSLAGELREQGAATFLAGPQAAMDYAGEIGWEEHPHRFHGVSKHFSFALQGPAEQAFGLLEGIETGKWREGPGILRRDKAGRLVGNPSQPWNETYLREVRWDNLYRPAPDGLQPLKISVGQVLQQVGCPYAAGGAPVEIDYPSSFEAKKGCFVKLVSKGCSFCDVAADKGFFGELSLEAVLDQIGCLPEDENGRKIPFELINENPLPKLPHLLRKAQESKMRLSQINLIMRPDWFLRGEEKCRESLRSAGRMGIRILLASAGLESFDDRLLKNFNKGLDVKTNLEAVRLMRRFKEEFPENWAYSRAEGAMHGFIHPTPWDTRESLAENRKYIAIYGLAADILPENSTPLIIHHGSCLGDWIRAVEKSEKIRYGRHGAVVAWWAPPSSE